MTRATGGISNVYIERKPYRYSVRRPCRRLAGRQDRARHGVRYHRRYSRRYRRRVCRQLSVSEARHPYWHRPDIGDHLFRDRRHPAAADRAAGPNRRPFLTASKSSLPGIAKRGPPDGWPPFDFINDAVGLFDDLDDPPGAWLDQDRAAV